jgi:hypothetical protein
MEHISTAYANTSSGRHDLDDSRAEVVRPMIEESMANMSRC